MGDKSPKPSKEYSETTQDVWDPQAKGLEELYGNAGDWAKANQGNISGLAEQQQGNAQGALDSAMPAWQQQLQGGTLGGYDIAGGLNNMIGQDNSVNAQNVNAQQVGPVTQSHAWDQYNQNVGPGGSLANMEGMFRRQADVAGQDMLSSLDARAAASGMSGGSRHGTGIGMGFEGINRNLQDQMATTGYDAYNRDLDRKLSIGSENDQFNQQRAMQDQASNLAGQQSNQQANLAAQQGNQNYASQQQNLMSGLLDQQNANTSGAIGQQQQMQDFMNGPMAGFMNSTAGMQFMKQMLGDPNNLSQQYSSANGATSGNSGSFNVGGIGGKWG